MITRLLLVIGLAVSLMLAIMLYVRLDRMGREYDKQTVELTRAIERYGHAVGPPKDRLPPAAK